MNSMKNMCFLLQIEWDKAEYARDGRNPSSWEVEVEVEADNNNLLESDYKGKED